MDHLAYYDLEAYLFGTVGPRFLNDGRLNAFDFFSIVIWKANRAKSKIARRLLENEFDIAANIWSVTSLNQLRRDGIETQRWNMLHPEQPPRRSHIEMCLADHAGPIIAATDYMKVFADQVRGFRVEPFTVLAGIQAGIGYDNNVALSDARKVGSMFVTVAPSVAVGLEGASQRYYVVYRGNYGAELLTAAVAHFDVFGRLADQARPWEELRAELGLAELDGASQFQPPASLPIW